MWWALARLVSLAGEESFDGRGIILRGKDLCFSSIKFGKSADTLEIANVSSFGFGRFLRFLLKAAAPHGKIVTGLSGRSIHIIERVCRQETLALPSPGVPGEGEKSGGD